MFLEILTSVLSGLLHLWPYLLVTVPVAVLVRRSGAAKVIERALRGRPLVAIVLATAVGAFSPFCSCSVIPVVASLLWGGVPLGPVMSFWIASPSMDPEIFFLSVASLGWQLAVWRLGSTLALSLAAGFLTQALYERGWLGVEVLRPAGMASGTTLALQWARARLAAGASAVRRAFASPAFARVALAPVGSGCCGLDYPRPVDVAPDAAPATPSAPAATTSCGPACPTPVAPAAAAPCSCSQPARSRAAQLLADSVSATLMVARFMALAVTLEVLFKLLVPTAAVTAVVGAHSRFAIVTAAAVGVPLYTSNLAAMPLVRELLASGMDPAAALAFLIAGPTTTIPAMAAVAGLVNRRVFVLYVSYAFFGAVVAGAVYAAVHAV
jgi:uncharacterized membrane protein YraQ (UPF0718 family)